MDVADFETGDNVLKNKEEGSYRVTVSWEEVKTGIKKGLRNKEIS